MVQSPHTTTWYRATLLGFAPSGVVHHSDGVIECLPDGTIGRLGPYAQYEAEIARAVQGAAPATRAAATTATLHDHTGKIITPGFIDTHIHFPQMGIMGAYGAELLEWLDRYVFNAEAAFSDTAYAKDRAHVFWRVLAAHGTTTSVVYSSSHTAATQILFEEADRAGARAYIGKTLMDRNAPEALLEPADTLLSASAELAQQWAAHSRLGYAFTPRFAPTCTEQLLKGIGTLWDKHPHALMQTHLSETNDEIAWVKTLFPAAKNYLDVYAQAGLLRPGAIFGHGIWLSTEEQSRIKNVGATVSHCPVSNEFLGSGHYNRAQSDASGLTLALGSDIAGGNELCMLRVADSAYKVAKKTAVNVSPLQSLWQITLGNAQAIGLGHKVGALKTGYQADLVILDPSRTPASALRGHTQNSSAINTAAMLVHLGCDRMVTQTLVAGVNQI